MAALAQLRGHAPLALGERVCRTEDAEEAPRRSAGVDELHTDSLSSAALRAVSPTSSRLLYSRLKAASLRNGTGVVSIP